jgi:hypothetical protein
MEGQRLRVNPSQEWDQDIERSLGLTALLALSNISFL